MATNKRQREAASLADPFDAAMSCLVSCKWSLSISISPQVASSCLLVSSSVARDCAPPPLQGMPVCFSSNAICSLQESSIGLSDLIKQIRDRNAQLREEIAAAEAVTAAIEAMPSLANIASLGQLADGDEAALATIDSGTAVDAASGDAGAVKRQ